MVLFDHVLISVSFDLPPLGLGRLVLGVLRFSVFALSFKNRFLRPIQLFISWAAVFISLFSVFATAILISNFLNSLFSYAALFRGDQIANNVLGNARRNYPLYILTTKRQFFCACPVSESSGTPVFGLAPRSFHFVFFSPGGGDFILMFLLLILHNPCSIFMRPLRLTGLVVAATVVRIR